MQSVLVDSNIFLDYYLDRRDNLLPLGEFASKFFSATMKCNYFIFLSKAVLWEICSVLSISEKAAWEKVFLPLEQKGKISLIGYSHEQVVLARAVSSEQKVPFNDALLAITAKEKGVLIVTRDNHFFEELSCLAKAVKPEELD
jgi:predicted nucleic acid-binding protein